jgi:hypothetical protein
VNSALYFSLYAIMQVVRGQLKWFEEFIFKPWIWQYADEESFCSIINHWITSLIIDQRSFLEAMSYFTQMLAVSRVIFPEPERELDVRSRSFLQFLRCIADVNFTPYDGHSLLVFCSVDESPSMANAYLTILHDVAPRIDLELADRYLPYLFSKMVRINDPAVTYSTVSVAYALPCRPDSVRCSFYLQGCTQLNIVLQKIIENEEPSPWLFHHFHQNF